jgi:antitoxin component YwqK of YwqJK toxin-antitoxin module
MKTTYLRCATLILTLCLASTTSNAITRCEVNSKSVNPSNGAELAGLTGMLRCTERDTGKLQREQELRNGKFLGLDRWFDSEGRLGRERSVNERGNNHGTTKEFWPSGQLRRESHENNGRAEGAVRSFYENGQLEHVSYSADHREQAALAFTKEGGLVSVSCHSASVVAEDRKPCGFDGKVRTSTVNSGSASGKPSAVHTYEQGKLLASTTYREDGHIWAELATKDSARWHRVYDARGSKDGKNVLREERLYEVAQDNTYRITDSRGALQWSKLWGANEQLIEHTRYSKGRATLTERWYLNGALKEKATTQGEATAARTVRESYDDAGRITERRTSVETPTWREQTVGVLQSYHANGKLAEEETYSNPDERGRTRPVARKQWDDSGKLLADDDILEDGSRKKR